MTNLTRLTVAQLAEHASRDLRLPERQCYRPEGGPLPRAVLLNNIAGEAKPIRWDVTNRITGKTTSYKTSAAASRAVDRMDNAYGAYICTRRAIYA